ncbi:MAG TPA: HAD family hydrolase [Longimicrobiales bacterium]|nr:HAD family hydrolase [Longimicrobiales bacterium]
MSIRAVFLDIGETLFNEARLWEQWADWLGVPHHTVFALLGALIERRESHAHVFDLLQPGFDPARARAERAAAGLPTDVVVASDVYPDAVECLRELRRRGYFVGIAANQPLAAEDAVRGLGIPVDVVATSGRWGVAKPDPAFFRRIVEAAGVPPAQIAYVGDRVDNDVLPALAAGMRAVFVRRGPWGIVHAGWPEVARADLRLDGLAELPDALETL